MKRLHFRSLLARLHFLLILVLWFGLRLGLAEGSGLDLVFSCGAENDIYKVVTDAGQLFPRYTSAAEAVLQASPGAGVLILADGYPQQRADVDEALFQAAIAKNIRLYVEYPAMVPNVTLGDPAFIATGPYGAIVERTVVTSNAFGAELPINSILMINDCYYLPTEASNPDLTLAQVEGYDTAVYGLPSETHPILFKDPGGNALVATTKLSQFVTGRYSPTDSWKPVWESILGWLQPGETIPQLTWTPTVRPMYGATDQLPANARLQALQRGVDYFGKSRLYIDPSWPPFTSDTVPLPPDWPVGDGTYGIGECYISKRIFMDGSQSVSRSVRADCNLEVGMALAVGGAALWQTQHWETAGKLNDLVFRNSNICQGSRADPSSPSYGLLGWSTGVPNSYWGDDNARALLSATASSAAMHSDRWNESIVTGVLANFRTTGVYGFRPQNISEDALQQNGWKSYYDSTHIDYCPHMESWLWANYLWLYEETGYEPLLERARTGIGMMMEAYPNWRLEANRVESERSRMLLPLAWLVRADDTQQHRQWLDTIAQDIIGRQDVSGAIPQTPGYVVGGNAGYGSGESAITHEAGDPATDALYAINFAFVGMQEAAAATGDPAYIQSVQKMADFFIRSQTQSETHSELDGTWYRGFDFEKWDYWASDGDAGWGVWTNEIGWTHSWITSTLALQKMDSSLWELSSRLDVTDAFSVLLPRMLEEFDPFDLNMDGQINIQDYLEVLRPNLGNDMGEHTPLYARAFGDFSGNMIVDLEDFVMFRDCYDQVYGQGAFMMAMAVPEPSSLLLLAIVAGMLLFYQLARHLTRTTRVSVVLMAVLAGFFFTSTAPLHAVTYRDIVLADRPAFYWTFDEFSGNAIEQVNGRSGDALWPGNFADRAASTTSGGGLNLGSAASFSGDAGQEFSSIDLTGVSEISKWAIEFWTKNNATDEYHYLIGGSNHGNDPAILAWGGGLQYFPNGGGVHSPPDVPPTSSDWQHIVMVVDSTASMGDGYRVYINGSHWGNAFLGSQANPFPMGQLTIGNWEPDGGSGGPYKGFIDELAIYNLSNEIDLDVAGQRIADHYSKTIPTINPEPILSVNLASGQASISTTVRVNLSGYSIASATGSLDPAAWNSLEDQDFEGNGPSGSGNGWEEGGGSNSKMLIETYLLGSSTIELGQVVPLGLPFSPGASQDLTFRYATQDNITYSGIVEYVVPIAGDANGDGHVDGSDVTILAGNWQYGVDMENPDATWGMGDFNDDGRVDGSDVTILAGNWQAGVTTAAAAVPEPNTIALLFVGMITLIVFRCRRACYTIKHLRIGHWPKA